MEFFSEVFPAQLFEKVQSVKRPNRLSTSAKTALDDDRGFPIEPSDEPPRGTKIALSEAPCVSCRRARVVRAVP
jgi:hypothetical protein